MIFCHCSVSKSYPTLRPHELQQVKLPCSSSSPRVCSNSHPLRWWFHPSISSSVTPFCSCPQSFPASGSFPVNWLFLSGGQSIGASASAVSPWWFRSVYKKAFLLPNYLLYQLEIRAVLRRESSYMIWVLPLNSAVILVISLFLSNFQFSHC